MPQNYRDAVLRKVGSYLAPYSGASVIAYGAGAVASLASTGTEITVHDTGHSIEAGDKVLINGTTFRTVDSATATSIVLTVAASVSIGDLIVNLGADTGSTEPNFDGSDVSIYSNPALSGSAISAATLSTAADGEVEFWFADGLKLWVVVHAGGTVLDTVQDVGGSAGVPSSSTDNAVARYNGTTGAIQNSGVTVDDSNNVTGVGNLTATGTVQAATGTVTGNATVGGTLGVTGALTASAAATVGTTLGVTGAATLSSTLAVTGAATFDSRVEAEQVRLTTGAQPTEKTIASGAISLSAPASFLQVDTESDAASDDLDTISTLGGEWAGTILVLRAANDARTVVVKNGTGNLYLNGSDCTLDNTKDAIVLFDNGSNWVELCRAVSNGA